MSDATLSAHVQMPCNGFGSLSPDPATVTSQLQKLPVLLLIKIYKYMKAYTQKFLRKRKMMTVLPILVTPFLILFAWALDVGKGSAKPAQLTKEQGINTEVPDAHLENNLGDKMSLYQQALKDSLDLAEQRRSDPYSNIALDTSLGSGLSFPAGISQSAYPSYHSGYNRGLSGTLTADQGEQKIRSKLAELEKQLQEQPEEQVSRPMLPDPETQALEAQLKQVMESLQSQGGSTTATADPEMAQMNTMLEKILDIQHPARAREKLRRASEQNKGQVFAVSTQEPRAGADLLQPSGASGYPTDSSRPATAHNAFFDGSTEREASEGINKAIAAVIHETQVLETGATIKMRLTSDIYVAGMLIPKDNFVYGVCSLDGERLTISVKYVRYMDNLFPVQLSVFDLDGIEGIRIPGAITRDAAKQGLDQAIQSMELYSLDPSLGAQATTAAVQTAKTLLSRKAKTIRATVRAGYPVLLLDENKDN